MTETPKVKVSKKAERFDAGNELWESKKLGASAQHAKPNSKQEDKNLDDSMGLQLLTIRVQKELIEQFKNLAKLEGIGYQPLMRQVLTRYARENEQRLQAVNSIQSKNPGQKKKAV